MALLALFAFVAGAGTALSPCSLPVLPALLSASATGGRRRPFGIVLGLAVTFCLTIVGLAQVVDGVGLGTSVTRDLAIAALGLFGVALVLPALGRRLEAPLMGLSRLGPSSKGDGFVSGLGVGGALGLVVHPASPCLHASRTLPV
jgi:cytochrome c biogenesis protein CcdA